VTLTACASNASRNGATTQVTSAWVTFFKGSTPAATRIALLQNGSSLAAVLQAQSHSTFARGLAAKVTKVTITTPTTATVHYALLIGGAPLTTLTGQAVKVSGTCKVSLQSFCGLLALEHVHPAVCTKA